MTYKIKSNERAGDLCSVGDVVYALRKDDDGAASFWSRATGTEYISVTFNGDGSYPFFSVPLEDLEDCSPEPEEPEEPTPQENPLYEVRLYMKSGNVIELVNLLSFSYETKPSGKAVKWTFHPDDKTFNLGDNTLDLDQIEAITHRVQEAFIN